MPRQWNRDLTLATHERYLVSATAMERSLLDTPGWHARLTLYALPPADPSRRCRIGHLCPNPDLGLPFMGQLTSRAGPLFISPVREPTSHGSTFQNTAFFHLCAHAGSSL